MMSKTRKKTVRTKILFSFWSKNLGRAIATWKVPGPSGFPYFSQLALAVSSVKAVYALVI